MSNEELQVRQAAYLKEFIYDMMERQLDGAIDTSQAAQLMWKEIDSVFRMVYGQSFENVASFRVEGTAVNGSLFSIIGEHGGTVIAMRFAGSRPLEILPPSAPPEVVENAPKTSPVRYVDVKVEDAETAARIACELEKVRFKVRDWTFGCYRK